MQMKAHRFYIRREPRTDLFNVFERAGFPTKDKGGRCVALYLSRHQAEKACRAAAFAIRYPRRAA